MPNAKSTKSARSIRSHCLRRPGWILVEAAGAVVLLLALALVTGYSARSASRAIRAAKTVSAAQEWMDNHVEAIKAATYLGAGELDLPDSAAAIDFAEVGPQSIAIERDLGGEQGVARVTGTLSLNRNSRAVPGGVEWTYSLTLSYAVHQLDGESIAFKQPGPAFASEVMNPETGRP